MKPLSKRNEQQQEPQTINNQALEKMATTTTLHVGLRVGGDRTRVEVAEAKAIVKRFETSVKDAGTEFSSVVVNKLDLSVRAWPLPSLHILGPFLEKHCSTITILNIQDIMASLLTDEGLQCLQYIATIFQGSTVLRDLDVSFNALGTRGIDALKPILSLQSLECINFDNCGLSAEVGTTLHDVLLPFSKHLQFLSLSRNQMGVDGCIAVQKLLKHCTSLQHFSYAGCRPLKQGTAALCQGILDMVEASVSNNGYCPLSYLNLDDCEINSGGDDDDEEEEANKDPIYTLCNAIKKCTKLSTLIVRDGNLKSNGLQRLVDAVKYSTANIRYLDVGCNELGTDGAIILSNFIKSKFIFMSLEVLICDTNEFESTGLAELVSSFQCCKHLSTINLQCNEITSIEPLLQMDLLSLRHLDLTENTDLTKSMMEKLRMKLSSPSSTLLYDDDLDDGDDDDDDNEENDTDVDDITEAFSQSQI